MGERSFNTPTHYHSMSNPHTRKSHCFNNNFFFRFAWSQAASFFVAKHFFGMLKSFLHTAKKHHRSSFFIGLYLVLFFLSCLPLSRSLSLFRFSFSSSFHFTFFLFFFLFFYLSISISIIRFVNIFCVVTNRFE